MALACDNSPEIRAEAAAWLARLRADDKSATDETAFRLWLAADARHAAAFEAVTEIWEAAGAAWNEPIATPPRTHRRTFLASAAALAAASVVFAVWHEAGARTYETGVGEQKHTALPDGTQVFLDTDTKIRAQFDGDTRSVALVHGRCNFHLRDNDRRPFVVDTAADRIVATRCTFDARRDGDEVSVVLIRGVAEVSPKTGSPSIFLHAGDRFVRDHRGCRTDRPNLMPLLAWQTGQAVFDSETVADAIREMNRYSVVKIAVNDAGLGNLRISGVYRVGDNVAFAHSIAALLPVVLAVEKDRVTLEPKRTRAGGI